MIFLRNYFVNTTDDVDVISVIHETNRAIREAGLSEGLVTILVPGPGAGVAIIEPLPDIVATLKKAAEVFPGGGVETIDRRKSEISIGPRIAAVMLGKTLGLPISQGRLVLAPREEIVVVDFERVSKRREFFVQVMGEAPQKQQQPQRAPAPRKR